jgi:N-acetyl-anhydromuramyl-L-alanine amidase AmpD
VLDPKDIRYIVVHCSATRIGRDIGRNEIDLVHKARGWGRIGYHRVIRIDGTIEAGRALNEVGAHVYGHNRESIGICLIGGVDDHGRSAMTFTPAQFASLAGLLEELSIMFPGAEVLGHRDLSPDVDGDGVIERHEWLKDCPCFDTRHWLRTGVAVFGGQPQRPPGAQGHGPSP